MIPHAIPSILIIDDHPSNIDILLGLLAKYDISVAVDGERALDQIEQEIPDLILLDVSMPGMSGYEVCSIIKLNPKTRDIPVLFLSAHTDSESVVKGFDVGGVDYIAKPYRPKEVLARVETHLKLKSVMDELEKLANEDPLTGIANRRHFFENAKAMFASAKSESLPLYVFVIDFDKFKVINDTFGHDVGDEVMRAFVKVVKSELGEDDCFARFGGDEFVIMMAHTNKQKALGVVKKIQDNISKRHLLLGVAVEFSVSIGMAEVDDYDEDIDTIIKRADLSLYKVKRSKRNVSRD
ncbi:MAG: diguanylate cyclase [Campylobacterota bacterium]|nr:diguanylate cyclase [Campylobacterota bacterium]